MPTGYSLHFFLLHIFVKLLRISKTNEGYYLYYNRYVFCCCLHWILVLIINVNTLEEKTQENVWMEFMFTRIVTYSKSKLRCIVMDDVGICILYARVIVVSQEKVYRYTYYPLSSCNREKGIDHAVTGNTLAHVSIASASNISNIIYYYSVPSYFIYSHYWFIIAVQSYMYIYKYICL